MVEGLVILIDNQPIHNNSRSRELIVAQMIFIIRLKFFFAQHWP